MLAETSLLICPEHVMLLVPSMLPQAGCWVIGASEGAANLLYSIIVILRSLLTPQVLGCQNIER